MRAAGVRGGERQRGWKTDFTSYQQAYPDLAAEFQQAVNGELPRGWDENLPEFEEGKDEDQKAG